MDGFKRQFFLHIDSFKNGGWDEWRKTRLGRMFAVRFDDGVVVEGKATRATEIICVPSV